VVCIATAASLRQLLASANCTRMSTWICLGDLSKVEAVLAAGRVSCFRLSDDDDDDPMIYFNSVACSFIIAFAQWLHDKFDQLEELGVGLGWEVCDVAAAVSDKTYKKGSERQDIQES
jgi:hypothetical protein